MEEEGEHKTITSFQEACEPPKTKTAFKIIPNATSNQYEVPFKNSKLENGHMHIEE